MSWKTDLPLLRVKWIHTRTLLGRKAKILLGVVFCSVSLLFVSCAPPSQLPGSARQALLDYWASLPSPTGFEHHIIRAWPGTPTPAETIDRAPEIEIWCVETSISAPEDRAVDGEKLIWIVLREDKDDQWTAALLAAMSSLWPYEACGEDR